MVNYFAEIDNENIVQKVIVVESAELATQLLGGTWVQTYMSEPTKNYAGKGYLYHPDKKNFSSVSPFPSWIMDDNCNWQPPDPYPQDGKYYKWNEEILNWEEI